MEQHPRFGFLQVREVQFQWLFTNTHAPLPVYKMKEEK
jgi:predicted lipid carrier protein YhbT